MTTSTAAMSGGWYGTALWIGGLTLLWWIPAIGFIDKFLGPTMAMVALPLAVLALVVGARWVERHGDDPRAERAAALGLGALVAVLWVAFFVVYPIADGGAAGGGSDADEALDEGVAALLRGEYPYHQVTYLGNPLTPMPGALVLALPFYAVLGDSALQNLLWIVVFAWLLRHWCHGAVPAALFFALFVVLNPATLWSFLTGVDSMTNMIYVMVAMYAVVRTWSDDGHPATLRVLAAVFLAVAVSSRPVFVVVLPAVVACVQQATGGRRTVEFVALLGAALGVLNLPFVLYDPASFSPLATGASKAQVLPGAKYYLPVAAILCSGAAFLVRLDFLRVCVFAGAALGIMICPVTLANVVVTGETLWTLYTLWVMVLVGLPVFLYSLQARRRERTPAY